MRSIKQIFLTVLIMAVFAGGFYLAYSLLKPKVAAVSAPAFIPSVKELPHAVESEFMRKVRMEQAVVRAFDDKRELITTEVELTQVTTVDDSWGDFGLFRKSQRVRFYGNGIYVVDLDEINRSHIKVDTEAKTLKILIPKPVIKSITIDETRTEYEAAETGWLRFGETKLTAQQYNLLLDGVKQAMEYEMNDADMTQQAEEGSAAAVKEIFELIINTVEDGYTVIVEYR